MKVELMVMVALAACSAVAMPTNDEIEKANADVMMAFRKQLAAWQGGSISDRDLSALMLMNAGKYKDEARHYVCLQAAFAGAVRAGDAVLAANAIEKIKAETKGFGAAEERKLVTKALEKAGAEKSKAFLRDLEVERAKIVYATPISDAVATTIAKMKKIMLPTLNIKPPATLKDVVEFMRKASKENDPRKDGVNFLLKTADGEPVPAVPRIRANNMSVYNALDLVLGAVDYDFEVKGDMVVIFKKGGAAKK